MLALAAVTPTRILVADDDEFMRALIASALRREGYVVIEASDGDELIQQALHTMSSFGAAQRPDAIVCDIRMPGRSGLQVVKLIRDAGWNVPIVLITAFGDEETHREAQRLGAEVLDKPFDLDELRTTLLHYAPVR